METIPLAICRYPGALNSALYGLQELFEMANQACRQQGVAVCFEPELIDSAELPGGDYQIVLLPPAGPAGEYLQPSEPLLNWLKQQHSSGCVLASACAGAFILAATGLTAERPVTTHWGLAERFAGRFPDQPLNSDQILIDHGDIITAGGMMSWLDLGFELVSRYASLAVMRQLGKMLVVDTAPREQRFYQQFVPQMSHGDSAVVAAQHAINQGYAQSLSVRSLADTACLSERTFQRRFVKATGLNPNHYIQRLRIQKVCDLLESSQHAFEWIAHQVGYEDASACRKVFVRTMGLTPKAFRLRFGTKKGLV